MTSDGGNLVERAPRKAASEARVDRLPPHAPDGERGILGCVLVGGRETLDDAVSAGVTADVWYDLRHAAIWASLTELASRSVPVDMITLTNALRDGGQLEAVGGMAYLTELDGGIPSAANLRYYVDMVLEKALLRKTIQTCTEIVGEAYEADSSAAQQVLDDAEEKILQIRESKRTQRELRSQKELVTEALNRMDERFHGRVGWSTGFPSIDAKLYGGISDRQQFVVIAARPSCGKTSMCMQIAEWIGLSMREKWEEEHGIEAPYNGQRIGIFSLEMEGADLTERAIASRARVNTRSMAGMTEAEAARLQSAATDIAMMPWIIDDTHGLTLSAIRARARRMYKRRNARVFVIDYLTLIASDPRTKSSDRRVEVDTLSRGIKGLSRELNCPVIVAAQLNREIEKDKARKPRMSDLRESGAIEQDADIIAFLYSTEDDDNGSKPREVIFRIGKQRNGPRDVNIPLMFHPTITRFEYQPV